VHVESHEEHVDRFRREYLMLDLFPENDRRFPITLTECLKERWRTDVGLQFRGRHQSALVAID
jgi:hypothetical protein